MSKERLRILKMIEEGKINADEGAQLLQALHGASRPAAAPGEPERRWFRLRVTDIETGEVKATVNVPLKLVQVGARMGARFVPNVAGVDIEAIMARIREGQAGVILDVIDDKAGERFEIFVE
ncbi:MAG: hypothetical protein JXB47_16105 [Anaerolineae bacterium]|nr:hypothetical protein [Anaerolineae bacterium]